MRYEIKFEAQISAENIKELYEIIDEIQKAAEDKFRTDTDYIELRTVYVRPFAQKSELINININK